MYDYLNFFYKLEQYDKTIDIPVKMIAEAAEKSKAYSIAIYFREKQFKYQPERACVESLISL